MVPGGHVIENPLSGERITISATAARSGGSVLEWELVLAPGGRVPSSHAHPQQEECFTVLAGQMRFRVGGRRLIAGPGGGGGRGGRLICWSWWTRRRRCPGTRPRRPAGYPA